MGIGGINLPSWFGREMTKPEYFVLILAVLVLLLLLDRVLLGERLLELGGPLLQRFDRGHGHAVVMGDPFLLPDRLRAGRPVGGWRRGEVVLYIGV